MRLLLAILQQSLIDGKSQSWVVIIDENYKTSKKTRNLTVAVIHTPESDIILTVHRDITIRLGEC